MPTISVDKYDLYEALGQKYVTPLPLVFRSLNVKITPLTHDDV